MMFKVCLILSDTDMLDQCQITSDETNAKTDDQRNRNQDLEDLACGQKRHKSAETREFCCHK